MEKRIAVLDADHAQCREIGTLLGDFVIAALHTLPELREYLPESECRVILIDLDTVPVDNRDLAQIKRKHPEIQIIVKSERTFHPELEEALRSHVLSCLVKPLDTDELVFWLKSIFENNVPSGQPGNRMLK